MLRITMPTSILEMNASKNEHVPRIHMVNFSLYRESDITYICATLSAIPDNKRKANTT